MEGATAKETLHPLAHFHKRPQQNGSATARMQAGSWMPSGAAGTQTGAPVEARLMPGKD